MENRGKGSKVAIILLILCVLGLGGFIGYDKFINNGSCSNKENSGTTKNNKIYTYKDLSGVYRGEETANVTDGNSKVSYNLSLYENGIFIYRYALVSSEGYVGNYIIDGDKIILNYIFKLGNSPELVVASGTKTIYINNDNTLIDKENPYSKYTNNDSVSLTVDINADVESSKNFEEMLKTYYLVNDSTINQF